MKWTARQATCHCIFVFEESNQKAITENAHCNDVCLPKRATEITLGLNRFLPPAAPGSRRRHPLSAAHSVLGLTDAKGSQRSAAVTDGNLPPLRPDVPEEEPSFPSSHDHPVTGFSSKHQFIRALTQCCTRRASSAKPLLTPDTSETSFLLSESYYSTNESRNPRV